MAAQRTLGAVVLAAGLLCSACTDRAVEAKREAIARGDAEAIALVKAFYTWYGSDAVMRDFFDTHVITRVSDVISFILSWRGGNYFDEKLKESIRYYSNTDSFGISLVNYNVIPPAKPDKIAEKYVELITKLSNEVFFNSPPFFEDVIYVDPLDLAGKFKIGKSIYKNGTYYIEICQYDDMNLAGVAGCVRPTVVVAVKNENNILKIANILYPENGEGLKQAAEGRMKGEIELVDEYKIVYAEIKKRPDIKIEKTIAIGGWVMNVTQMAAHQTLGKPG